MVAVAIERRSGLILHQGIHAAYSGDHIDNEGSEAAITSDIIQQIADSYNPDFHYAPLVVGHNHPMQDTGAPAYGWVEKLNTKYGLNIYNEPCLNLYFDGLFSPQLDRWLREKKYDRVSICFYGPNEPTNPKPGYYYLRHIAYLGAAPPAMKGLEIYSYAEPVGVSTFNIEEEKFLTNSEILGIQARDKSEIMTNTETSMRVIATLLGNGDDAFEGEIVDFDPQPTEENNFLLDDNGDVSGVFIDADGERYSFSIVDNVRSFQPQNTSEEDDESQEEGSSFAESVEFTADEIEGILGTLNPNQIAQYNEKSPEQQKEILQIAAKAYDFKEVPETPNGIQSFSEKEILAFSENYSGLLEAIAWELFMEYPGNPVVDMLMSYVYHVYNPPTGNYGYELSPQSMVYVPKMDEYYSPEGEIYLSPDDYKAYDLMYAFNERVKNPDKVNYEQSPAMNKKAQTAFKEKISSLSEPQKLKLKTLIKQRKSDLKQFAEGKKEYTEKDDKPKSMKPKDGKCPKGYSMKDDMCVMDEMDKDKTEMGEGKKKFAEVSAADVMAFITNAMGNMTPDTEEEENVNPDNVDLGGDLVNSGSGSSPTNSVDKNKGKPIAGGGGKSVNNSQEAKPKHSANKNTQEAKAVDPDKLPTEFSEFSEEQKVEYLDKLSAQLGVKSYSESLAQSEKSQQSQIVEFAESLYAGNEPKLTEGIIAKDDLVSILSFAKNPKKEISEFSEANETETFYGKLTAMLNNLPPVVNFSEVATTQESRKNSKQSSLDKAGVDLPKGRQISQSGMKRMEAISAFCEQNDLDMSKPADFRKAMKGISQ